MEINYDLIKNGIEENRQNIMVVFGDSWSMDNYPYVSDQNSMWHHIIAQQLNLRLKNYAVSGSGYSVTSNSFISQLNTAQNDVSLNKDQVRYVFIYGGINDLNFGDTVRTQYETNVETMLSRVKAYFTKSQIIVLGCNTEDKIRRGAGSNSDMSAMDLNKIQCNVARDLGLTFICTLGFLYGYTETIDQNNHHPTELGQIRLGSCILSALNGNTTNDYNNRYVQLDMQHTYTSVTLANLTSTMKGNMLYITINYAISANYTGIVNFNTGSFTNLPFVRAGLYSAQDGTSCGVASLDGSSVKIICKGVPANHTCVAVFTIQL